MEKTVGFICHPYNASLHTGRGHDRYAFELIRAVQALGVNTVQWEGNFSDTYGSGGAATMLKGIWEEMALPFRLRHPKVDLYHATSPIGGASAALLGKTPLVTSILDVIHLNIRKGYDMSIKYRFKKSCTAYSATRSDRIITLFASTKQALMENFKVSESRIKTIPIGIDHGKFSPGSPKPPSAVIVFIGEATRSKGLDTLIEAMPAVLRKCPRAELRAGSHGRDLPAMKSLAQSLGVADKVKFLGFIPEKEIRDFYLQGDCAAFPSRYGFGLPTLEAMACGIPTVAGDTLDAPEFVGDAGLLVEPGNAPKLAEAILDLLTDEKLHSEYSARGLRHAREYSWEAMGRKNVELYREMLA